MCAPSPSASPRRASAPDRLEPLVAWLCPIIARACQVEPSFVTPESAVLDLGLDSLTLVSVLSQVEVRHGIELEPDETLGLLDAPNVRALAEALAAIIDARERPDEAG